MEPSLRAFCSELARITARVKAFMVQRGFPDSTVEISSINSNAGLTSRDFSVETEPSANAIAISENSCEHR